jgi:outer membrane protein assembly factor BamA
VVFFIEEGPVYRVADILLTGNTRFPTEQLRSKVLQTGDIY